MLGDEGTLLFNLRIGCDEVGAAISGPPRSWNRLSLPPPKLLRPMPLPQDSTAPCFVRRLLDFTFRSTMSQEE